MSVLLKILVITKNFWKLYLLCLTLVLTVSVFNLVQPLIIKHIVDLVTVYLSDRNPVFEQILWFFALMIAVELLALWVTVINGYLGDVLGEKIEIFLMSKFYEKVLALDVSYFDNESKGALINQLKRGIWNITSFVNEFSSYFLGLLLTIVLTIVLLATYSSLLALLFMILVPVYVLLNYKSSQKWLQKQEQINNLEDSLFGRIVEVINSIRLVKASAQVNTEYNQFLSKRWQVKELRLKQSQIYYQFDWFKKLSLNSVIIFVYIYALYNTYKGVFTIAEFVLFAQLAQQIKIPLTSVSYVFTLSQSAIAGAKSYFEIVNQQPTITDLPQAKELRVTEGEIRFANVTFAYNKKLALDQVSFVVKPKSKVAIVGESGAGKSTIANLLLRFYQPDAGAIYIDGQNIQEVTLESLYKQIAVVFQDTELFSGTILENILYGKPEATLEEVKYAARMANVADFVEQLPEGYNTLIGERGVQLSGGQKQRLAIARAIISNKPILILDEATSALDSKTEKEIQKSLEVLMQNKTTLIIAHRLATIKNVDYIIVLKDGKILEEGTPAELYQRNGFYTQLVKLQSLQEAILPEKGLVI